MDSYSQNCTHLICQQIQNEDQLHAFKELFQKVSQNYFIDCAGCYVSFQVHPGKISLSVKISSQSGVSSSAIASNEFLVSTILQTLAPYKLPHTHQKVLQALYSLLYQSSQVDYHTSSSTQVDTGRKDTDDCPFVLLALRL